MEQLGQVLMYALLPAVGHSLGALLAECVRPPRWVVGVALHGAAGIAIALVSIDFMPRVLKTVPMPILLSAFVAGCFLSLAAWRAIKVLKKPLGSSAGALAAYGAVTIDLISDGLMTGAGAAIEARLGLFLAAAQAFANMPGGFAVTADLSHDNISRFKRLSIAAGLVVPVSVAAVTGMLALQGRSDMVQNTVLMVIAGMLLLATIEDTIPEGDAPRPPRVISTIAFGSGFVALALSSHYLN